MKQIILVTLFLLTFTLNALADVTSKVTKKGPKGQTLERVFYQDGNEIAKKIFNSKGVVLRTTGQIPDGTIKGFLLDGKLESEFTYKDNKKNGIAKFYDEKEQLVVEINFENDLQQGIYREYFPNGKLSLEMNYKNDIPEGEYKLYYDNGNTFEEGEYIKNQLIIKKVYTDDGHDVPYLVRETVTYQMSSNPWWASSRFNPPIYVMQNQIPNVGITAMYFDFENNTQQNIVAALSNVYIIKDSRQIFPLVGNNFENFLLAQAKTRKDSRFDNCNTRAIAYKIDLATCRESDIVLLYKQEIAEELVNIIKEPEVYSEPRQVIPETRYSTQILFPYVTPPYKLVFTARGKKNEVLFDALAN